MKKIIIAFVLAVVMVVGFSLPAFAWGGENTDVAVSPIVIDTGGNPLWVGYSVTTSGMVTIVSNASAGSAVWVVGVVANSSAEFSVTDPSSGTIASGSSNSSDFDSGFSVGPAGIDANAGQIYTWLSTFTPAESGWYTVYHDGTAFAGYFTLWPFGLGADSDSASGIRTFWVSNVPSGCGDPTGGLTDRFIVIVNSNYPLFTAKWVEQDRPWIYGRTLAEDLNATWGLGWGGQMHQMSLFIPKGTGIHGLANQKAYFVEVSVYQDQILFPRVKYLYFSQPVVLAIDGKVIIFDQIVNGEPMMSSPDSVKVFEASLD